MAVVGINWAPFREEFPILFSSKSVISMWVGEGWFELMWCLSSKLEPISRRLVAEGKAPVRFIQVKESDGGLRCYVDNGTEEVERYLLEAQARSLSTCEACGRPGSLVTQEGWCKTLCPSHELEP
jgi:hypothetical protein